MASSYRLFTLTTNYAVQKAINQQLPSLCVKEAEGIMNREIAGITAVAGGSVDSKSASTTRSNAKRSASNI